MRRGEGETSGTQFTRAGLVSSRRSTLHVASPLSGHRPRGPSSFRVGVSLSQCLEYCFLWLQTVKRRAGPYAGIGCRRWSLRLPRMYTARCDRPFSGQARRPSDRRGDLSAAESFPPCSVPDNHSSPGSRDSPGPHLRSARIRGVSVSWWSRSLRSRIRNFRTFR